MSKKEIIIKLIDGGVTNFKSDKEYVTGYCDTCDYGNGYVNYININLTKCNIEVYLKQDCGYGITEEYMLKMFLRNIDNFKQMTEEEFCDWVEEYIQKDFESANIDIH